MNRTQHISSESTHATAEWTPNFTARFYVIWQRVNFHDYLTRWNGNLDINQADPRMLGMPIHTYVLREVI